MPWEPFRPWGPVSAEGIRLGPPPWLGQLEGLRFCGGGGGERARGAGWVGGQRLRGAGCWGRKHIWIFAVSLFGVEGLPGQLCLAWPWRGGPVGPDHWPIPTFRHFREKLMTASVWCMVSSSSTVSTPLACPERPLQTEGVQGTLADLLFP